MRKIITVLLLSFLGSNEAINRSVYKILLTQKGYAQFVQYDIEIPPLREFTFCLWIRLNDVTRDQTIFTYLAESNRVARLWIEAGANSMKLSIGTMAYFTATVALTKHVWRHVCLSYQSDFGAYALYLDGHVVSCEVSQAIGGYYLPGGGSIIIGYGINDDGLSNGFEGEIFGANMILKSTIEKNYTIKGFPQHQQTIFNKNKVKVSDMNNIKYVILDNLKSEDLSQFSSAKSPLPMNRIRKRIRFTTPSSTYETDSSHNFPPKKLDFDLNLSNEKEILDIDRNISLYFSTEKNKMNLWNIVNKAGKEGKFKKPTTNSELSQSSTQELPKVSIFETPPPPGPPNKSFYEMSLEIERPPNTESINKSFTTGFANSYPKDFLAQELYEVETPPPLQKDSGVFGQWTSSKFASNVLNYLKSINFQNRGQNKVPVTIPLTKISDSYPYASNFKVTKAHHPLKFQRRNFVDKQIKIIKRELTHGKEINVKILEDGLRDSILASHAQTKPMHVQVTNRGLTNKFTGNRHYRRIEEDSLIESSSSEDVSMLKTERANLKNHKMSPLIDAETKNNLLSILPFLKSVEYFIESYEDNKGGIDSASIENSVKSSSVANKWHNSKSYSNDYTPRQINIEHVASSSAKDEKFVHSNKETNTFPVRFHKQNQKFVADENFFAKDRELAFKVSSQSNQRQPIRQVPDSNYNHNFVKISLSTTEASRELPFKNRMSKGKSDFNKTIKIGNALNERDVFGLNEKDKLISFIGGNDKVPDIHQHRSEIDRDDQQVPPSLASQVCKLMERFYDRILYIHPDGSIGLSNIISPIKEKSIAVEFILTNYKKCSLEESALEGNPLLLINWNKTPVRLFGGAFPSKTKDLCGFF